MSLDKQDINRLEIMLDTIEVEGFSYTIENYLTKDDLNSDEYKNTFTKMVEGKIEFIACLKTLGSGVKFSADYYKETLDSL